MVDTLPEPLRFGSPPDGVRLVMDLVNTRPVGGRPDLLADTGIATAYLRQCGHDIPDLDKPALWRARGLRDALVDVLGTDPGDPEHADGWHVVNELAAKTPLTARFVAGPGAVLDGDDLVGRLIGDIHAAVTNGRWSRLRLCANDVCRVAFYDASRSRTQRWHSYEVCGNRVNVAAHRRRQR